MTLLIPAGRLLLSSENFITDEAPFPSIFLPVYVMARTTAITLRQLKEVKIIREMRLLYEHWVSQSKVCIVIWETTVKHSKKKNKTHGLTFYCFQSWSSERSSPSSQVMSLVNCVTKSNGLYLPLTQQRYFHSSDTLEFSCWSLTHSPNPPWTWHPTTGPAQWLERKQNMY